MIDSLTVSGVEGIRALARADRPEPTWGHRCVSDMLAELSNVEQVLRLLPSDLRIVAAGHDRIQLVPEDFCYVFHGLTARVTRSSESNHRTLWVSGVAIVTCEPVKEGWQVPQLEASFEVVPEA